MFHESLSLAEARMIVVDTLFRCHLKSTNFFLIDLKFSIVSLESSVNESLKTLSILFFSFSTSFSIDSALRYFMFFNLDSLKATRML